MFQKLKQILGFRSREAENLLPHVVETSYGSISNALESDNEAEELGISFEGDSWELIEDTSVEKLAHLFDGDNIADFYRQRLNDIYLDADKISRFDKTINILKRIADYPVTMIYTAVVGGKGSLFSRAIQIFSNIIDVKNLYQGKQSKAQKNNTHEAYYRLAAQLLFLVAAASLFFLSPDISSDVVKNLLNISREAFDSIGLGDFHSLLLTVAGLGVGDLLGQLTFRALQYRKYHSFWPDNYELSHSEKELLINKNHLYQRDPAITQRIVYLLAYEIENEQVLYFFMPVLTSEKYNLLNECKEGIKHGSDDLAVEILLKILMAKLKLSGCYINESAMDKKLHKIYAHEQEWVHAAEGALRVGGNERIYESIMYYLKREVYQRRQHFKDLPHENLQLNFKDFIVFAKNESGKDINAFNYYLAQWLTFTIAQVMTQNLEVYSAEVRNTLKKVRSYRPREFNASPVAEYNVEKNIDSRLKQEKSPQSMRLSLSRHSILSSASSGPSNGSDFQEIVLDDDEKKDASPLYRRANAST